VTKLIAAQNSAAVGVFQPESFNIPRYLPAGFPFPHFWKIPEVAA
jgi:hypothetical protein